MTDVEMHDAFAPIAARVIDTSLDAFELPSPDRLRGLCEMAERTTGLRWAGEASGAYLVMPGVDGNELQFQRHRVYGAARLDDSGAIERAAIACVHRVASRFGRGTYWTTGGRAHVIAEDERPVVRVLRMPDGDVAAHVIVRLLYFHDGGASLLSRPAPATLPDGDLQEQYEIAEREAVAAAERAQELAAAIAGRTPK